MTAVPANRGSATRGRSQWGGQGAVEANGGAAKPARGTARLGAEDHSVLVADGEGAAAAPRWGWGALCLRRPPLRSPACRILGEAPRRGAGSGPRAGAARAGARSQEGGKGAERGG